MSWTLEQFGAACQRALTEEPGSAGRQKVSEILRDVLKDDAFIAKHLGDDVPERKVLYEDPKLGFCILAHVYNEGDLHSPRREGSTRLIRIEGTNMDKVRRLSYEKV